MEQSVVRQAHLEKSDCRLTSRMVDWRRIAIANCRVGEVS